jgi:hypothetical protein
MSYPVVSFKSDKFKQNLLKAYQDYGMCVITDVISPDKCDSIMNQIITSFENLGSGLDRNNLKTWNKYRTPVATRPGMYQSMVANLPIIWKTKTCDEIVSIFDTLYREYRPDASEELIVSNDGINIKPGGIGPFHDIKNDFEKDWVHIDQTVDANPYNCIQG